jgi:hypothetical protein
MSREDYVYYARLAEQGERYEDMIKYMKEVSKVRSIFEFCLAIIENLSYFLKDQQIFES